MKRFFRLRDIKVKENTVGMKNQLNRGVYDVEVKVDDEGRIQEFNSSGEQTLSITVVLIIHLNNFKKLLR